MDPIRLSQMDDIDLIAAMRSSKGYGGELAKRLDSPTSINGRSIQGLRMQERSAQTPG